VAHAPRPLPAGAAPGAALLKATRKRPLQQHTVESRVGFGNVFPLLAHIFSAFRLQQRAGLKGYFANSTTI